MKDNKGLTLAELIVCLAIFGILLAAVFGFMLTGSKTYTRINDRLELNVQSQLAVSHITEHFIDCNFGVGTADGAIYAVNKEEDGGYTAYIYAVGGDGLLYSEERLDAAAVKMDDSGVTTVKIPDSARHILTKYVRSIDLEPQKYVNKGFSPAVPGERVDSLRLTLKAALRSAGSEETHELALRNKPSLLLIEK